jgi:hypothetical protein
VPNPQFTTDLNNLATSIGKTTDQMLADMKIGTHQSAIASTVKENQMKAVAEIQAAKPNVTTASVTPSVNAKDNVSVASSNSSNVGVSNIATGDSCSSSLVCASIGTFFNDSSTPVGAISTIAGLTLATERTVLTNSGTRIPRLPLTYGMDIFSYQKATKASAGFNVFGNVLGGAEWGYSMLKWGRDMRHCEYDSARQTATSAFYGALMMAPPHFVTVPVGLTGLAVTNDWFGGE